jgi:uncharacterized paraquat-inducible protein A
LSLENLTLPEEICPRCQGYFRSAVFHPPQRIARVFQIGQSGPESAGSCANHPRNAAVTNCGRCGLFICSLCELDLHGVKYCPSCFDRLTKDGGIEQAQTRFRDWGALAIGMALFGLLFDWMMIGVPFNVLSVYYAIRGFRDPQFSRDRIFLLTISTVLALLGLAWAIVVIAKFLKVGTL